MIEHNKLDLIYYLKMNERFLDPIEREKEFEAFIVSEYLKYASVDEVFRRNNYDLPISYPGVHRLIDRWGIVKTAGPNSKLSEAISFLTCLSDRKVPLERMYKNMPPSFQTSLATMHRIMHNIKEGVTRRSGTALMLTPGDEVSNFLVATDVSTPRIELGKPFGSISVPMTFSKNNEPASQSILRVFQQEVFTQNVLKENFPFEIIPDDPEPYMYLDIADVRVGVYHIELPRDFSDTDSFSSFKMENYHYINTNEAQYFPDTHFRSGIVEMAKGFSRYRFESEGYSEPSPYFEISHLNQQLALAHQL